MNDKKTQPIEQSSNFVSRKFKKENMCNYILVNVTFDFKG